MKLSTYLDEKFVFTNLEGDTKDEIIKNLVEKVSMIDKNINLCSNKMKEAILKREHEISTCIGNGIIIPHARVEDYDDIAVIIAKLDHDIETEIAALHQKTNARIAFMIVAGKTKNKIILKLMSSVSRLAQNPEFLQKLQEENNPHNIVKLIKSYEREVKDRITAEDIMNSKVVPAKLNDTLEEIAKRLILENMSGFPVEDDFGNFVGEITERELIEYGMPKYTSLLSDLSFMTVGEPFEEYFKNEERVTVEELYRKNPTIVDRKASIMEVSFTMVTKGNTRIYVVEDGMYYGMILRSDIIKKVLHI
jgi:PTS system nitrogen regulatory IIA component